MAHTVCRIPGDGIGREVMDAATFVLNRMGLGIDWIDGEIGWKAWERHGATIAPRTWDALDASVCALYGAVIAQPAIRDYTNPLIDIRRRLNLFAGCCPVSSIGAVARADADQAAPAAPTLTLWRLLGEDHEPGVEFAPIPRELIRLHRDLRPYESRDAAASLRILSAVTCRRFAETVLRQCTDAGIRRVTVVHRGGILRETDGLFRREFRCAASPYPSVHLEELSPSRALIRVVEGIGEPEVFASVGLAGEMLQAAAVHLAGGPGLRAASELGDRHALFQPLHGPHPEIAGRGIANPVAMLRAAGLMLEYVDEPDAARQLAGALDAVLRERTVVTPDLGGQASTLAMAEAVANRMGL